MKQTKSLFLIIFLVAVTFCSCKKEKINPSDCTAGCKTVRLSGQVLDVSSNEGLRNTEVKAHFYQSKACLFFCFGEPVETFAQTITDDQGRFNVDIIVDTGVFDGAHSYRLNIYANASDNYILGNGISFIHYNENFSNITLTKYKKTKLNIKFKRDSSDIFNHYVADYFFRDNINAINIQPTNQADYMKLFSQNIPDTTIEVNTGANFWTKVKGRKFSTTSTISENIDSIFCNANTINTITIKY